MGSLFIQDLFFEILNCGNKHIGNFQIYEIAATSGTWLQRAVTRFGLKGNLDKAVTEEQWRDYFRGRALLELREAATLKAGDRDGSEDKGEDAMDCDSDDDEHESVFANATWPQELGERPKIGQLGFESYREGPEEREMAARILGKMERCVGFCYLLGILDGRVLQKKK